MLAHVGSAHVGVPAHSIRALHCSFRAAVIIRTFTAGLTTVLLVAFPAVCRSTPVLIIHTRRFWTRVVRISGTLPVLRVVDSCSVLRVIIRLVGGFQCWVGGELVELTAVVVPGELDKTSVTPFGAPTVLYQDILWSVAHCCYCVVTVLSTCVVPQNPRLVRGESGCYFERYREDIPGDTQEGVLLVPVGHCSVASHGVGFQGVLRKFRTSSHLGSVYSVT